MLRWCSADRAVTQHNLKMNVHPITGQPLAARVLAVRITCLLGGSRASKGPQVNRPHRWSVLRQMGPLSPAQDKPMPRAGQKKRGAIRRWVWLLAGD